MQSTTRFTIVIPTYDRPARLAACLSAIKCLDYSRHAFEVVVVDDGSPGGLESAVIPYRQHLRIQLVRQANRGPAAARNAGARVAQGEYLAFTDDDCAPDPGWLAKLDTQFARMSNCLVGGGITNGLPQNPFATSTQLIVTYVYEYHERRGTKIRLFNTSNLAVSRERFLELGGFDESFVTAEDYDFCHRWQNVGYKAVFVPEATVQHAHGMGLAGFWRQHFGYGRGLLRFRAAMAHRTAKPMRSEGLAFYLELLRYPLTQHKGIRGWMYSGLIALSQAATLLGALSAVPTGMVRTKANRQTTTPDAPSH